MQNNIKPLRANMREVVTTFEGEEMFIVPKKGGFGQDDNEGFVMVAGKGTITDSTPRPASTPATAPRPATTTSTSTPRPASTPAPRPATTTSTSTPRPASTPAPAPRPATTSTSTPAPAPRPATTSTSTPRPTSSGTFESTTPRSTTTTPRPVPETTTPRSSTSTPSTTTPRTTTTPSTTSTPLPTIPNFNNLSKEELHAQVISLGRLMLQTTIYTPAQIQVLTNAKNQALALYNSKFGTTTPRPTPTPTPTPVTLPTFTNVASMSCDGLTAEITRIENIVRTTRFTSTAIADAYNRQLASAKTLKTSKCNVTPTPTPTPTPLPTFPNFTTLSCDNLKAEISRISNIMQTSRFGSAQVTEAYTRALANAKQVLSTKCATPTPTPTPTPKPDPMPTPVPELPKDEKKEETPAPVGGGGGAIGGGGGGGATDEGLGEQPTAEGEQPTEEEQKPNYSWLWILLVIGGIYVATRKKK